MHRRLSIEQLAHRIVFNGSWHNAGLPCDVDRSGLVTSEDVQLIVASLTDTGFRLIDLNQANVPLAIDVSQDGLLSPLDVLRVVNVLNAFSEPLSISANRPVGDLDRDGLVLASQVTLRGSTLPGAQVSAVIDALNLDSVEADSQGNYQLTVDVASGENQISLVASDPRGRTSTAPVIVRRGDAIHSWNGSLLRVVRSWGELSAGLAGEGLNARSSPPQVARGLAMLHAAMFDAINQFNLSYEPYMSGLTAPPSGASPEAAAAGAAYVVAKGLYPGPAAQEIWDATLTENLAGITDATARELGLSYGKSIGEAILASRATDGAETSASYLGGTAPGEWRPTLPAFQMALLPQWPNVTPFVVDSVTSFRPAAPPNLSSPEYAIAVDEVMRLGASDSNNRTADQTALAQFWADGAGTATPPGHWNRIAADVTQVQSRPLLENARLFALLNFALADAGIASWDAKYAYDLWRPVDAIRQANNDGNPETNAVEDWLPMLATPPFPAYTSGHSTFSGAGAEVLTILLGETTVFASTSDPKNAPSHEPIPAQQVRSFSSFRQAAEEAGLSRIYGGIHFSFDNTAGLQAGKAIGEAVVANALRLRN